MPSPRASSRAGDRHPRRASSTRSSTVWRSPRSRSKTSASERSGEPRRRRFTSASRRCAVMRIEAVRGDITREEVHAVVNAANEMLVGGGGVDGAIHRAAGADRLHEACRRLGGCPTGDAKATPGFDLPARWIIHAVGPVWRGGGFGEPELLASCYRRSLAVADELGAASIAFPAISTGIYGYPKKDAAQMAVATLRETVTQVEMARLVAFDAETFGLYRELLRS